MKIKTIYVLFVTLLLAGCQSSEEDKPLSTPENELESSEEISFDLDALKSDNNPFRNRDSGVMLVQAFADEPTFDLGDDEPSSVSDTAPEEVPAPKGEVIDFSEPAPAAPPEPAVEPSVESPAEPADEPLGAFHNDGEALRRGQELELRSVIEMLTELQAEVEQVKVTVNSVKSSQLTADDVANVDEVRTVVKEELEAFKQVVIEWHDKNGKLSSSSIPIDEDGKGEIALPPGAQVATMGGVPIEQWKAENPDAVVTDGSVSVSAPVKSGGSNGGSNAVSSAPPLQYSVPLSSAGDIGYESSIPLSYEAPAPITTPTQYYESPNQFTAAVSSTPQETQVLVEVDQSYMQPAASSSQCYTDPNTGQTVCPTASSAAPTVRSFQPLKTAGNVLRIGNLLRRRDK